MCIAACPVCQKRSERRQAIGYESYRAEKQAVLFYIPHSLLRCCGLVAIINILRGLLKLLFAELMNSREPCQIRVNLLVCQYRFASICHQTVQFHTSDLNRQPFPQKLERDCIVTSSFFVRMQQTMNNEWDVNLEDFLKTYGNTLDQTTKFSH